MKERPQLREPQIKSSSLWLYFAFIFIVFGAKAVIISNFGSSVPFWDQWSAEGLGLYCPLIDGTLRWTDLFSSHNEHRIFTTKVLHLLLFKLNSGVWDPMVQMYANAAIHTISLVLLLFFLQKGMTQGSRLQFFAFATLLFAVPYGHQNTLSGFQSQFYFLLLFSFPFLWSISRYRTGYYHWFFVIVFSGFMSFFSLASGILTIAAGIGTLMIRWICGIERTRWTAVLIIVLAIFLFTGLYFTSAKPETKSLLDFTIALSFATGGGLLYTPVVLFMIRQLQKKPSTDDYSWFVFSLSLWVLAQIFATAFSRGSGILTSRYLDILSIGILLNGYCILFMLQKYGNSRRFKKIAIIWFLLIIGGLVGIIPSTLRSLENKYAVSIRQKNNVNGYLASGDYTFLQKKPHLSTSYLHINFLFYNSGGGISNRLKSILEYLEDKTPGQRIPYFNGDRLNSLFEYLENKTPGQEIPYPDVAGLKSILDNKTISSILTPEVNNRNSNKGLGLYTEHSKQVFLLIGIGLFFIGILLFLFEGFILYKNRKKFRQKLIIYNSVFL
ncbi:MAG: hypothetical protein WCI90_05200 [Chlorobium sp.]|nr:MAG: hypothetical protein FDX17_05985 [Chlorobium sp.]